MVCNVCMHVLQEEADYLLDFSSARRDSNTRRDSQAGRLSIADLVDAMSHDDVIVGDDDDLRERLQLSDAAAPLLGVVPKDNADGMVAVVAQREVPKDQVVAGMLYYATSSVFVTGMGICSKMLENEGYPVWELLFIRAIILFLFSLPALLATGAPS